MYIPDELITKLKQTLFSVTIQDCSRVHDNICKSLGSADRQCYMHLLDAVMDITHYRTPAEVHETDSVGLDIVRSLGNYPPIL